MNALNAKEPVNKPANKKKRKKSKLISQSLKMKLTRMLIMLKTQANKFKSQSKQFLKKTMLLMRLK